MLQELELQSHGHASQQDVVIHPKTPLTAQHSSSVRTNGSAATASSEVALKLLEISLMAQSRFELQSTGCRHQEYLTAVRTVSRAKHIIQDPRPDHMAMQSAARLHD